MLSSGERTSKMFEAAQSFFISEKTSAPINDWASGTIVVTQFFCGILLFPLLVRYDLLLTLSIASQVIYSWSNLSMHSLRNLLMQYRYRYGKRWMMSFTTQEHHLSCSSARDRIGIGYVCCRLKNIPDCVARTVHTYSCKSVYSTKNVPHNMISEGFRTTREN